MVISVQIGMLKLFKQMQQLTLVTVVVRYLTKRRNNGINSSKIAQQEVEGIGFAIPINIAKPVIESLEKTE